ncbi:MAG: alcohol dehydrogenase catalytic domain-containing protein [Chloroflexi bacterium]|nr:alcohol dehydrogenase catalytic domain-containing protein [Chloroflexota bacterium]
MRALVLTSPGKFEIRTVPVPPVAATEVLCRVHCVAICGSDPEIVRGESAGVWPPAYPFTPGHEWSGEIVVLGHDVTDLQIGDRVAGQAHKGCGVCANCLAGRYTLCENYGRVETGHRHYGFISPGAYAQFIVVSIKSVNRIPAEMTFREGALVDSAGAGLHGLELTGVTPGGTIAIIGAGSIGLITMRLARLMGAARVIAIDRGARLQAAQLVGADVLIDFERDDPLRVVRVATDGHGVDEVIECAGAASTFRQAVEMVRRGGRVALLGTPAQGIEDLLPTRRIVHDEIAIFGSRANPNTSSKIINLIAAKQLMVADLITHVFPLEDFATAFDYFVHRRDNAIKVVLEPNA